MVAEKELIDQLYKLGISNYTIARLTNKKESTIKDKIMEIRKLDDSYNKNHIVEKYNTNKEFLEMIKPDSILDLFCGQKSFYKNLGQYEVMTNDLDASIDADYHLDASEFLDTFSSLKFDIIDVDPFGNCVDLMSRSIAMANKGIIFSLGDFFNLRRFKLLSRIESLYGMTLEEFTIENVTEFIIKKGLEQGKVLTPVITSRLGVNKCIMLRLYFKVEVQNG